MVWATKVVALSTSLMVRVPAVVSAALVSVRLAMSADSTAASLVPRIFTVTEVRVPSALLTAKVSV
ncbi:hypothetical protein D3C85_1661790 [compost metagenome]